MTTQTLPAVVPPVHNAVAKLKEEILNPPTTITALQTVADDAADDDLPKMQQAYRMKLAGKSQGSIAQTFGVCRQTIYRWFLKIEEEAIAELADEPILNVIVREVHALRDLETQNRESARNAKSERSRVAFLAEARRAATARTNLLLSCGIIPKAPDRIYAQVSENKRQQDSEEWDSESVGPEARKADEQYLLEKLRKGRLLS